MFRSEFPSNYIFSFVWNHAGIFSFIAGAISLCKRLDTLKCARGNITKNNACFMQKKLLDSDYELSFVPNAKFIPWRVLRIALLVFFMNAIFVPYSTDLFLMLRCA